MYLYEVEQVVKVVNSDLDTYGKLGVIVDVDENWSHPYELKFDEEVESTVELYAHSDIQLYIGDVTQSKQKTIEDIIAELILVVGVEKHTRENALTITKLQEARMWYIEGKKIHGEGENNNG